MPLLSITIAIGVAWCLHIGWPWYRYWTRARHLNLPRIISPTSPGGYLWTLLRFVSACGLIPGFLANVAFIRLTRPNWAFRERFSMHEDYGRCFIVVSPSGYELFVADREAAKDILSRRYDFPKQTKMLGMWIRNTVSNPLTSQGKLDKFGKNVASVEGQEWKRHRKLVAKAFHEKVNDAVWTVSAKQARALLDIWTKVQSVHTTQIDMTTLSLNVLFKACINVNGGSEANTEIVESCQSHLTTFLNDIIRLKPFNYRAIRKMKANAKALAVCLHTIVASRLALSSVCPQADLLSFLLNSANEVGFANGEITGNLFMVMFAGHETTANALLYIIYLLAIFPPYQNWAIQEIDRCCAEATQSEGVEYSDVYPGIVRLRAVLYETLRLYGPVPSIFRGTSSHDQPVRLSEGQIIVPRNTNININALGMHTDPDTWGPDCHAWRPSRWIDEKNTASDQEAISDSKRNSLFAWSAGSRVCPGEKFSQAEVFAVLLHLLRRHRVEIVPQLGQDVKEAQAYAYSLIEKSRVGLTLHIPQADLVHVRWIER